MTAPSKSRSNRYVWAISRDGTRGMKMRCRGAIKQLGPFIDGELGEVEANALREHLDACAECSRRYHYMRGLVRQLSSLPAIVPTPEESYRLMNRLRREMATPAVPRPATRRTQLAAAALSVLVLITVAGLGMAIWNGGGPTPVTEETAVEAARSGETQGELGQESSTSGTNAGTGLLAAAVARPDVVVSQNEYDAADLEEFRNDLGTRLDFYSTYWYPSSGGTTRAAALEKLRTELTSDLTEQAAAAGQNPEELQRAVTAVMEQADDESILPCYAERAKIEGKDAWLISASGPEDYLLFPDQQRPPAMILASLGGEESLKVSESALKELASLLAPSGSAERAPGPRGNVAGTGGRGPGRTRRRTSLRAAPKPEGRKRRRGEGPGTGAGGFPVLPAPARSPGDQPRYHLSPAGTQLRTGPPAAAGRLERPRRGRRGPQRLPHPTPAPVGG